MDKIKLIIAAIANSESQPNSFVVILKEEMGNRRLPIVIGGFEAQAIAIAVEGIKPNRPLTHDLFKNSLTSLGIQLKEVLVSDLKGGIFYATLFYLQPDGSIVELDARTSDAIALAIRFQCPIYAMAFILDEAGIALEEPSEDQLPDKEEVLTEYSSSDLERMLNDALENENYEKAAEIRDELNRREK